MLHLIVVWLVSALALWIVAQIIPGIRVRDFGSALIAAAVIATRAVRRNHVDAKNGCPSRRTRFMVCLVFKSPTFWECG